MKAYVGLVEETATHILSLCLAIPNTPQKGMYLLIKFLYNGMFRIEDENSPKGSFKILLCEGEPDRTTMKQVVLPPPAIEFFKKVFENFEPTE